MMERWLRRVVAAFRQNIRYRITLPGYLFAGSIAVVAGSAVASGNNLLFLILAAMLATLLISGVVSRLTLAGLVVELGLPEHIAARQEVRARIRLRNFKWFPSFAIRLEGSVFPDGIGFPMVPSRSFVDIETNVVFPTRGRHAAESLHLATRFPFGFVERRTGVPVAVEPVVYPALEPSAEMDELRESLANERDARSIGRGTDFYRLRRYEHQESARNIDWKSSAHTGELHVREFAREEPPGFSVYFDACAGEEFEGAVEACAYLVWMLSGEGAVAFHSQGAALEGASLEGEDVYAILKFLALISPEEGCAVPPNADDVDVLFSMRSEAFEQLGWRVGRVVGRLRLGTDGTANSDGAQAGRGEDVNHGGGTHNGGVAGQRDGCDQPATRRHSRD